MSNKAKYITLTALMLALTIAVQSLRTIVPGMAALAIFGPFNLSTLVIGSLVNLILMIATWRVGITSGITVSVLSTVIAFLQGHLPIPHMIPVVAVGNIVICVVTWLLINKNMILAVVCGAIAKYLALWGMVSLIIVPIISGNEAMAKMAKVLSINFSWPQLVTALVGGMLACLIWPRIKKATDR